jgi:hypothetical protein
MTKKCPMPKWQIAALRLEFGFSHSLVIRASLLVILACHKNNAARGIKALLRAVFFAKSYFFFLRVAAAAWAA